MDAFINTVLMTKILEINVNGVMLSQWEYFMCFFLMAMAGVLLVTVGVMRKQRLMGEENDYSWGLKLVNYKLYP